MKSALALSEARTIARFEKRENQRSRRGYSATAEFAAFAGEPLQRLADHIQDCLRARDDLAQTLRDIGSHQLALAGLASLMHSIVVGRAQPGLTIDIGKALQGELWAARLLKDNKRLLSKIAKIPDTTARLRAAKKAGFRQRDWSQEQLLKAGNWVLNCCLQALPDVFELLPDGTIDVRDDARELALALRERAMWSNPVIMPCTEAPKPWTGQRAGGFWDERSRLTATFVRTHHKDTEQDVRRAFRDGSMVQHVDGVNALQAVPWRINEPVLEVVKRHADRLGGVGRLKTSESLLAEDISTAERLRGAPFYLPMNCDFRGRVYPIPHFNFQREDHVRSLFLFERGLPSGPDGNLKWLMAHVATLAPKETASRNWHPVGFQVQEDDRKNFPGRLNWTLTNWDLIERTAKLETDRWLEAEKPFAFFAACLEVYTARTTEPEFITRLPITFDGTCSGLQHLCAMTRDELGGTLVNLRASGIGDAPQDIYAVVAEKVAGRVRADEELRGIKIDRKLVKRPVMTYFYGATQHGMTKQIQEAVGTPNPGWRVLWRIAEYVIDAIRDAVPRAEEAQAFLQSCAEVMARAQRSNQWTTPTGFPWSNRYHKPKTKRVELILRGIRVQRTIADGHTPSIVRREAVNGVAPNVVHALDAAHLLRTVNACRAAGIDDILAIHDCYACLTPKAEQFNAIMREEFVRMYREHDPLNEIREWALCSLGPLAPGLFPQVPERGPLDLSEFLKSHYAFC